MDPAIIWMLIIIVAGWFVLAAVAVVVRRDILRNEHELQVAVFCIFTWPAWLAIGVLGLPVALGLLVGMLIRELAKQFRGGA